MKTGGFGRAATSGARTPVSLACEECKSRNYKTTKSAAADADASAEPLSLRKFCKTCKRHTVHRETR